MEKREEYNEIITTAVNRAGSSLKHFFELLNLDPELFKHLCEIDVRVEELNVGNAKYNSKDERYITLSDTYLDSLKNKAADYKTISEILKRNLSNPEFLELHQQYEDELFRKLGLIVKNSLYLCFVY